jgi:hypothetical protein
MSKLHVHRSDFTLTNGGNAAVPALSPDLGESGLSRITTRITVSDSGLPRRRLVPGVNAEVSGAEGFND